MPFFSLLKKNEKDSMRIFFFLKEGEVGGRFKKREREKKFSSLVYSTPFFSGRAAWP